MILNSVVGRRMSFRGRRLARGGPAAARVAAALLGTTVAIVALPGAKAQTLTDLEGSLRARAGQRIETLRDTAVARQVRGFYGGGWDSITVTGYATDPDDVKTVRGYFGRCATTLGLMDRWMGAQQQRTSLTFGYSGDEGGGKGKYTVNAKVGIGRGEYPRRTQLTVETSVRIEDGLLAEDVAQFVANYNSYPQSWLEGYVFIERFSDSYLGVDQRYEVGVGMLAEGSVWSWRLPRGRALRDTLDLVRPDRAGRDVLKLPAVPGLTPTDSFPDSLWKATHMVYEGMRRANSLLTLGCAMSVLAEVERSHLSVYVDTLMGAGVCEATDTRTFIVPASTRYRVSLRPTLDLRPADDWSVRALCYFKLPLGGPYYVNDRFDFRVDAEIVLCGKIPGNENLGLTLRYRDAYDHAPPRLGADVVAREEQAGRRVRNPVAPDRHKAVSLSVELKF